MLKTCLGLTFVLFSQAAAGDGHYCNPVLNVNTCYNSTLKEGNIQVTTELQVENVTELFRKVSESLLSEYEKRFKAFVGTLDNVARPCDCGDIQRLGFGTGVYVIYPDGRTSIRVRCDMDMKTGGWTVIQRRVSDTDFYKTWNEYRFGFGDLSESFWLGNDNIHMISSQGSYELRIDMSNDQNETRHASYDTFLVADVFNKFKLSVGFYHGDAGDSLKNHNDHYFSTKDVDNDGNNNGNCAATYLGAWWYHSCHGSNLNGEYGNTAYAKGIIWSAWEGHYKSLHTVEMKIRKWRPEVTESTLQP